MKQEGKQEHIDEGYIYTYNDLQTALSEGINQGHQDFMYVGAGAGDYAWVGGQ